MRVPSGDQRGSRLTAPFAVSAVMAPDARFSNSNSIASCA